MNLKIGDIIEWKKNTNMGNVGELLRIDFVNHQLKTVGFRSLTFFNKDMSWSYWSDIDKLGRKLNDEELALLKLKQ